MVRHILRSCGAQTRRRLLDKGLLRLGHISCLCPDMYRLLSVLRQLFRPPLSIQWMTRTYRHPYSVRSLSHLFDCLLSQSKHAFSLIDCNSISTYFINSDAGTTSAIYNLTQQSHSLFLSITFRSRMWPHHLKIKSLHPPIHCPQPKWSWGQVRTPSQQNNPVSANLWHALSRGISCSEIQS